MWKKLANLPRHEHNYAFLVRHFGETDIITSLFDRTTVLDDNLHCESGYCCGRRICKMPNGKLLAVCNDDSSNCPELEISDNDRRIFSLNLKKIASLIANLTKNISIFKQDVQTIEGSSSCIRVGYYIPRGTIRYPVFFGIDIYDGDLESIINHVIGLDESAILLLPSIDNIGQARINSIRAKGSDLIGLQNLQGENCLLDAEKTLQSFNSFFANIKDPDPKIECKKFSSPSSASWDKFIFEWQEEQLLNDERTQKAHKREVIIVTCGNETQRYEPADLHMLNKKTNEPNLQWVLLTIFIKKQGIIGWNDQVAVNNINIKNLKTQKKELIRKLKKAFRQSEDPIPFVKKKGYTCRFTCRAPENTL
ncbi:hypothetical protein [Bartonella sp. CM120XJJH]|uniref:hypothetical protein n=1 Tax=Bartonella sp. CM120XJJH TaxID=3243544 RepID=UPI0035CED57F